MDYDGKMVTPDRRKGLLRVVEERASGMKQFQWCDPETKNAIESYYIFPGDAKFEKVKQSKDRVYLLEMVPTKRRYFYWIQEDEPEKDKERCTKVHNVLNGIADTTTPDEKKESASNSAAPSGATSNAGGNAQAQQDFLNQLLMQ